jgi:hypothetical protein
MLRSSMQPHSFKFSDYNFVRISHTSSMCATFPSHLTFIDLITIILVGVYKLSYSSNNFHHPLVTFLLGPNILYNLPSRLRVHISLSYRTGKISCVLESLHFWLPHTMRKAFPLNLFVNEILICCCHIQSPELSHIFITLIIQLLLCCINVNKTHFLQALYQLPT